jgi:hypothetical protein
MRLIFCEAKGKMKLTIKAVFLFSFLVFSANIAYSCTCSSVSHHKEFRQSDTIFAGQVIDIAEDKSFVPPKLNDSKLPPESLARLQKIVDSQKRYLVKFEIEQKFKGVKGQEITLYTIQSESPCSGIEFVKGEKYLIYGSRDKNGYSDNGLCSRTQKLDKADKEFKELSSSWFRFWAQLPFSL